jgi:uncharacterized protein (DUF849 family)
MTKVEISRRTLIKSGAAVVSGVVGDKVANARSPQRAVGAATPPLVKVALNGQRSRANHPAIPITPEETAAAARESVTAGAGAIHIHPRSEDGRPTLNPDDIARALNAVRAAVGRTPIGVSTGAFIERDVALRFRTVERWVDLPDFASVNMREEGAGVLAELLLSRGVGIEAGLMDVAGAQVLLKSGLAPKCLRWLLEPGQSTLEAALQNIRDIESELGSPDGPGMNVRRLLHGTGATAWALIDEAARRGYDTRVGFEDILTLPDNTTASSNGALVFEALRRMRAASVRP